MIDTTLRLTRPMMHGSAVRRVQELLGITPQDGIYGRFTEHAVRIWQAANGLVADGVVGPRTWRVLVGGGTVKYPIGEIVDIRDTHPPPENYARRRAWSAITGVTLHQTGCDMPADPFKWGRVNAHYGVTAEGVIVYLNPEEFMIWHGHGLSQATIGIEIEGNFAGVDGVPSTVWRGGGPAVCLSRAQKMAFNYLYQHLEIMFESRGQVWRRVYGHRQGSNARRACPGSEIWDEVGLRWKQKLGLGDWYDGGANFRRGSGAPIPTEWDSDRIARY